MERHDDLQLKRQPVGLDEASAAALVGGGLHAGGDEDVRLVDGCRLRGEHRDEVPNRGHAVSRQAVHHVRAAREGDGLVDSVLDDLTREELVEVPGLVLELTAPGDAEREQARKQEALHRPTLR